MIWQDYVTTTLIMTLGFLLIPQIRLSLKGSYVSKISSGATAVVLFRLAGVFGSLGLTASIVATCINATAWAALFGLAVHGRTR